MLDVKKIQNKIRNIFCKARNDKRGVNAVEFALISTMLLPMFAGLIDYSHYLWNLNEVAQAVRAGAQYSTANPTDYTNIAAVVKASTSLGTDTANFTVSANQCYCGLPIGTVMTTLNSSQVNVAAGACTTVLASCTTGGYRGYLIINATYNYKPLLGSLSLAPTTATATVKARVQ